MKKSILMMMFAAASLGVFAQTDTNNGTTMSTNANYNAYSVPSHIQVYLVRDYPTAANVTWAPVNDYWRATYDNMGRYNHVYYTPSGDHFSVALPVTSTWVPDEIISRAGSLFGANIYDITALKASNGMDVYQVRFLDNGVFKSEWIDNSGIKVTEYYRTDDVSNTNVNTNTNMNMSTSTTTDLNNQSSELKIKTKTENGQTKTKIKRDN